MQYQAARLTNDCVCQLLPQTCLTTIFASNNGGLSGGCLYFDITVTNPVRITNLETKVRNLQRKH